MLYYLANASERWSAESALLLFVALIRLPFGHHKSLYKEVYHQSSSTMITWSMHKFAKKTPYKPVTNYRPISTTSVFARKVERKLESTLVTKLQSNFLIAPIQQSFRTERSIETKSSGSNDQRRRSLLWFWSLVNWLKIVIRWGILSG